VFVDTAPVMEKPLAQYAGLGWQGKHTNLVARDFGSWLFLGSIFTTLDLSPDAPEHDHCGSCRACLDVCPTQAFIAPYQLDARLCVSYLTIEHKGVIDRNLRPAIGNRIYGCDDCLAACPWNKYAQTAHELKLIQRDELAQLSLAQCAQMDEAQFRTFFAGGPIKRIGHQRFLRNVLIAIANSGQPAFMDVVTPLLSHHAALVRGMAVWAAFCLLGRDEFAILRAGCLPNEGDADVRAEWIDHAK
jgi:epoxyqueuosine reductase